MLSSGVPPQIYTNMSIPLASGSSRPFEFPEDEANDHLQLDVPAAETHVESSSLSSASPDWHVEPIHVGELQQYDPFIRRHNKEMMRADVPERDRHKTVLCPIPVDGQLTYLEYRVRIVVSSDKPTDSDDALAGFRLVPSSALKAPGKAPAHQDGWPLCIVRTFRPLPDALILHMSGWTDEARCQVLLDNLIKVARQQGEVLVKSAARSPGDPITRAFMERGGNIKTIRTSADGWPPEGLIYFGDGEIAWRGQEFYGFP